ncbi:hypothetical protein E4U55_001344 [Claviceps digitariae]|nr:hypothetical protein E4U55_001344 [Claviceps digitariae]
MGRRKIEIKAIKDDRNRSVTFLKRKGGLFKKAHELSVLCSVDVAVFIFGNNKKLYEYSSVDMRELINRYQYHGGQSEHKGPEDFSGGNDDDEDEDGDGTPPRGPDSIEHQMMPPQFPGHQQPPFPQIRHHTPSASPPIPNGGPFQTHPGHPGPRGSTPQSMGSRPGSRNDMRRIGPGPPPMAPQPHGAHPGISYMPTPPIYQPSAPSGQQPPSQYSSYPPPQQQQHQQQQHQQQQLPPPPPPLLPHQQPSQQQQPPQQSPQQQQQHQQQQQQQQQQPVQHPQYMDDHRPSVPPAYPPQPPLTSQSVPTILRTEPTPSQATSHHQMPSLHPGPHISPPPHPERRFQNPPQPPPPFDAKMESSDRPQRLLLNTDTAIKKMPQKKSHSIFTPIEENRSILSQHLASFTGESPGMKAEPAAAGLGRSQSVDVSARGGGSKASPQPKRSNIPTSLESARAASTSSSGAESSFAPPSRSNSLKIGGLGAGSRPRGPRLTVQIPDGASESGSAGTESRSPHGSVITPTQAPRPNSVVLPPPPPSPSASALLSAGASGPPNPFARPPPQQTVNGETPVSALPSRFLHNDLLPSPSNFYQEWTYRGHDSNTLPSPLNFATPTVGTGPSFLRDDHHGSGGAMNHSSTSNNNHNSNGHGSSGSSTTSTAATTGGLTAPNGAGVPASGFAKRKSPEYEGQGIRHGANHHAGVGEAKRAKVEYP